VSVEKTKLLNSNLKNKTLLKINQNQNTNCFAHLHLAMQIIFKNSLNSLNGSHSGSGL